MRLQKPRPLTNFSQTLSPDAPQQATVAILTFYKGHFLNLEKAASDANLWGVEVLTVDSCQVHL